MSCHPFWGSIVFVNPLQEPVAELEKSQDATVEGGTRAAMLGSCIHLDSLVRVSRSTGSCIYELCLSG
jgi:hypothetical protein